MARVQIFLSTVSAEFRSYREALRHHLTRPNVSVAVQEDFIVTGTETLDMLDDYIQHCDAVIHLVGDMTGALAHAPSLALMRSRYPDLGQVLPPLAPFLASGGPAVSYTEWEAWLALYHRKLLFIAVPEDGASRDPNYELIPEQQAAQAAHLQRLAQVERYPAIRFKNAEQLAVAMLRSSLQEILARAGPPKKIHQLPYPSLGDLFKGREAMLNELRTRLCRAPAKGASAMVGKALHGLGGVGKSRLAVECAWRHTEDYTALLFVRADSPEEIQRNLATLCKPEVLDLPEHQVPEETVQFAAAIHWLQRHPGWLLILDNVDTEEAAQAVEALLPQLPGGHVLITSRLSNWSGGIETLPLEVLKAPAAVEFLLARTEKRRRKAADDVALAQVLAEELGHLALALEQAGAYVSENRLSLAGYLAAWRNQRDKVLTWYNPRLMQYPASVAVTWQTSFDQLGKPARWQRTMPLLRWQSWMPTLWSPGLRRHRASLSLVSCKR